MVIAESSPSRLNFASVRTLCFGIRSALANETTQNSDICSGVMNQCPDAGLQDISMPPDVNSPAGKSLPCAGKPTTEKAGTDRFSIAGDIFATCLDDSAHHESRRQKRPARVG